MSLAEYQKALRIGLRENHQAKEQGRTPGLLVLPDSPEKLAYARESLGIVEIPIELVVGTCNALRADAFSPNFSPVMPLESEFAIKWESLCAIHLEEGIRDPIKVVEYLNRYYVVEGHKRVSILKYFGAVSIPGNVTRLIPHPSDNPEVLAYQEFLSFYRVTGLLFLVFRQPSLYSRLAEAIGLGNPQRWGAEDSYAFRTFYYMFREACRGKYDAEEDIPLAFLTYVEIFGYEASLHKLPSEMSSELDKISQEIRTHLHSTESTLVLEDNVKPPLLSILRPSTVKVAFIHHSNAFDNQWTYSHEYGRYRLAHAMRDQVETLSYDNASTEEAAIAAMEQAINQGANMIFTTHPSLLLPSVKVAVLHPEVKILNCSLNTNHPSVRTYFPRLYGAKFIKGVVAGTLAQDGRVGYITEYPTYGSIANINAFAQGVHMVNANARVYLEWSELQSGDGFRRLYAQGIHLIDYRDQLGMYTSQDQTKVHNMALIQCYWGRMYQSIVRRAIEGSWKQEEQTDSAVNYWWGMPQGVVSVLCSRLISSGTRRLVGILRDALHNERLDPFYGTLYDQTGTRIQGEDTPMSAQQILTMNWLSSLVVGRLPEPEEFTPSAQELIRLQGLERWKAK